MTYDLTPTHESNSERSSAFTPSARIPGPDIGGHCESACQTYGMPQCSTDSDPKLSNSTRKNPRDNKLETVCQWRCANLQVPLSAAADTSAAALSRRDGSHIFQVGKRPRVQSRRHSALPKLSELRSLRPGFTAASRRLSSADRQLETTSRTTVRLGEMFSPRRPGLDPGAKTEAVLGTSKLLL